MFLAHRDSKGPIGGDVCFVLGIRKGSSFHSWVMPVDDIIPHWYWGSETMSFTPRFWLFTRVFHFFLAILVQTNKHDA